MTKKLKTASVFVFNLLIFNAIGIPILTFFAIFGVPFAAISAALRETREYFAAIIEQNILIYKKLYPKKNPPQKTAIQLPKYDPTKVKFN